jgi:pimeloyl-ACP methyl ester carboxylesterase
VLSLALFVVLPVAQAAASCPQGAQCSAIQVPISHAGAVGGTLPLGYSRVPATATSEGTLVLLSGGPGQSAIPFTRTITSLLDPLHLTYDFVFPDQRGTGRSGATTCKKIGTPAEISACAAALGDKRAYLNTTETAEDIEDLRVALGVDKLTLLGVSYGTKVAGAYARLYPQHTAAVILDSPVGVESLDGTFALRQAPMPRVLKEVCDSGPCAKTVKDPGAALDAAVKRLQQGPVRGPLVTPTGKVKMEAVDEATLYSALLISDQTPLVRLFLPSVIESLSKGDAAPFLHLAEQLSGGGSDETDDEGINNARELATSCIESSLPWAPDSPIASRQGALTAFLAANSAPFAPFRPQTVTPFSAVGQCMDWPPTPAPAPLPAAGPDVPVLVLSGRDDLRTPLEDARRIAAQYPHAQFLSVPGVGHSVLTTDGSGCAASAVLAFVRGKTVRSCNAHDTALDLDAVAYLPSAAAALKRTRLPGSAGRALTALRQTIASVSLDTIIGTAISGQKKTLRLAGLRAGYTSITGSRLTLHGVQWFKGLRVNGYFDNKANVGQLTVVGPGGGTIDLRGSTATGTLGVHAIRSSDLK